MSNSFPPGSQGPADHVSATSGASSTPGVPAAPVVVADAKKPKNTIGTIALVSAILGLILSCVKGALLLGWLLLPIGFILGIVGACLKGKPKGRAITAIIVSIVGTIIAACVFVFVIGSAIDEAFNEETSASAPGAAKNAESTSGGQDSAKGTGDGSAEFGTTRENPLPVGSTVETADWAVTINSVDLDAAEAILAHNEFNDAPAEGEAYVMVNATITYKGDNPDGEVPSGTIQFVTAEGVTVSSSDRPLVEPEQLDSLVELYNGGSITGNIAFAVPAASAGEGTLVVRPSLFATKRFVAVQPS
ncbi:DUF2232 domain-containing protein [Corynebacterium lizhenjunii]|uniref:DUF2232 domain-containing protein n=1 Tax=Corynebacterium lizhenjunii TaxID=2709394 RepID=A0A7T0PBA2_9CORY|nr:DUF2232 domain-containing protein [Corynebacterium lizhenjunii]QPK79215.1 DUF2232 domain-containing protein [Corynebacterium lizhenjunii]